jgi:hypothetical protein
MRERLESFMALCKAYDLEGRKVGYAEYTDTHRNLSDQMASLWGARSLPVLLAAAMCLGQR